jgi:hypothetical protein
MVEITKYPEGFTGADLRRQLGIKEKTRKFHNRKGTKKAFRETVHPILKKFWRQFRKMRTPEGKLALLKGMAEIVVPNNVPYDKRRKARRKWKGRRCLVCAEFGFHIHHIIQVQNGGNSRNDNLILLCDKCHGNIHPWIVQDIPAGDVMRDTMERVEREA